MVERRVTVLSKELSNKFNMEIFGPAAGRIKSKFSILIEIFYIFRILCSEKGIVHAVDFTLPFSLSAPIIKLRGHKIVYDTGNIHSETWKILGKNPLFVKVAYFLERSLALRSNCVVSRGHFLIKYLEQFGVPSKNILFIPDPVDVNGLHDLDKYESRIKLKLKTSSFIIGYAAKFEIIDIPNVGKLPRGWEIISILEKFREMGIRDVVGLFIGSGDGLAALKELSNSKDLNGMCVFSGFVTEEVYRNLINSIDVGFMEDYDLPAYKTSIGAKVQDYMASGKAVVTGRGEERDYLLHSQKEFDLLFSPLICSNQSNVETYLSQILEKLQYIRMNKQLLSRIGMANTKRAETIFSNSSVIDSFNQMYRSMQI